MKQKSSKAVLLSSIVKGFMAFALLIGMMPLFSTQSFALAEKASDDDTFEIPIAKDLAQEPEEVEEENAPLSIEEEDTVDDEVDELSLTETEASDQRANSFRYVDGEPINIPSTDGMQSRDMSLRAGASSYISFGQGPCTGSDANKGIDVSLYQGNVDWGRVKFSGVSFAILRCGTGKSNDPYFAKNVQGCQRSGMQFGVYYYTYATSPEQGAKDAQRVLSQLKGISANDLTYPIYYDLEDEVVANMSSADKASLTKNFIDTLRANGYSNVGVYSNMDWWCNQLTDPYFKRTDLPRWVAQYNTVGLGYRFSKHPFADFRSRGDVWQFSSSGRVDGISGDVDLNYSYYNMIGPAPDGAMFRLYNPNGGEHFYTASSFEGNHLITVGWRYEGIAWIAPTKSNSPVYRLYNPNGGDHHYTMSAFERDALVRVGWNYEGIGWYSDDSKNTALFRLYNPNAKTGSHHYTTSAFERDALVRVGWNFEGIGWYGK